MERSGNGTRVDLRGLNNPEGSTTTSGIKRTAYIEAMRAQWRVLLSMNKDDAAYFYQRAEAELEMAQTAEHPAAVKAHYLLATHYLDSLHDLGTKIASADPAHG